MRIWMARGLVLGILAAAGYAFWRGTPLDIVNAVRVGNAEALKSALARDPANVHTKVYAQAVETQRAQQQFRIRTGRDPWEGRYLIHDAVEGGQNALAILDVLAAGGADLNVRLNGLTLLHLTAAKGNLEVTTWLLDHGADVNAVVDCTDGCAERGYTPLHSGLAFRDIEMTELLLARGARMDTAGADGRTAMHVAAGGKLSGAFVLARHGADLTRTDAAGKTPYDLAGVRRPDSEITDAALATFAQWFAPGGPLATVSALVRANGTPMSDEAARNVFAKLDTTPR